eukprot:TRINITY_DN4932_c0_g2_i1.p1 TRINITY_DN4932_c0_g2~~TRINITY_DN4932_c0_g2_i1.p1  ORF type:complete len:1202 (-),score=342.95 TRINITY_DN4932_c0_g2_i1:62-3667(-)
MQLRLPAFLGGFMGTSRLARLVAVLAACLAPEAWRDMAVIAVLIVTAFWELRDRHRAFEAAARARTEARRGDKLGSCRTAAGQGRGDAAVRPFLREAAGGDSGGAFEWPSTGMSHKAGARQGGCGDLYLSESRGRSRLPLSSQHAAATDARPPTASAQSEAALMTSAAAAASTARRGGGGGGGQQGGSEASKPCIPLTAKDVLGTGTVASQKMVRSSLLRQRTAAARNGRQQQQQQQQQHQVMPADAEQAALRAERELLDMLAAEDRDAPKRPSLRAGEQKRGPSAATDTLDEATTVDDVADVEPAAAAEAAPATTPETAAKAAQRKAGGARGSQPKQAKSGRTAAGTRAAVAPVAAEKAAAFSKVAAAQHSATPAPGSSGRSLVEVLAAVEKSNALNGAQKANAAAPVKQPAESAAAAAAGVKGKGAARGPRQSKTAAGRGERGSPRSLPLPCEQHEAEGEAAVGGDEFCAEPSAEREEASTCDAVSAGHSDSGAGVPSASWAQEASVPSITSSPLQTSVAPSVLHEDVPPLLLGSSEECGVDCKEGLLLTEPPAWRGRQEDEEEEDFSPCDMLGGYMVGPSGLAPPTAAVVPPQGLRSGQDDFGIGVAPPALAATPATLGLLRACQGLDWAAESCGDLDTNLPLSGPGSSRGSGCSAEASGHASPVGDRLLPPCGVQRESVPSSPSHRSGGGGGALMKELQARFPGANILVSRSHEKADEAAAARAAAPEALARRQQPASGGAAQHAAFREAVDARARSCTIDVVLPQDFQHDGMMTSAASTKACGSTALPPWQQQGGPRRYPRREEFPRAALSYAAHSPGPVYGNAGSLSSALARPGPLGIMPAAVGSGSGSSGGTRQRAAAWREELRRRGGSVQAALFQAPPLPAESSSGSKPLAAGAGAGAAAASPASECSGFMASEPAPTLQQLLQQPGGPLPVGEVVHLAQQLPREAALAMGTQASVGSSSASFLHLPSACERFMPPAVHQQPQQQQQQQHQSLQMPPFVEDGNGFQQQSAMATMSPSAHSHSSPQAHAHSHVHSAAQLAMHPGPPPTSENAFGLPPPAGLLQQMPPQPATHHAGGASHAMDMSAAVCYGNPVDMGGCSMGQQMPGSVLHGVAEGHHLLGETATTPSMVSPMSRLDNYSSEFIPGTSAVPGGLRPSSEEGGGAHVEAYHAAYFEMYQSVLAAKLEAAAPEYYED